MMRLTRLTTFKLTSMYRPSLGQNLRSFAPVSAIALPQTTSTSRKGMHPREAQQLKIDTEAGYLLSHPDLFREVHDRHKIELQKVYDLRDDSESALLFSGRNSRLPGNENAKSTEECAGSDSKPLRRAKVKRSAKTSKKTSAKQNESADSLYKAKRQQIRSSLLSFVEVSVHAKQYECALQVINHYRVYLKRLHQRRSSVHSTEALPVEIYNKLLSGCADNGDFRLASETKQLMMFDNVAMDASSYAYLLATAQGKADMLELLKDMSSANITLDDLFQKAALTEPQLDKLLANIRSCDNQDDFEIPHYSYPENRTCRLIDGLDESRVPFSRERLFDEEFLRKQATEQMKRELAGNVKIRSVAAPQKPSERVLFLRQQVEKCENEWRKDLSGLFDTHLQSVTNEALHSQQLSMFPYLLALDKATFIEIMIQEMRMLASASESFSMSFSHLAFQIGHKVETQYRIEIQSRKGVLNTQEQIYSEFLKEFDPVHTTPGRRLWQSIMTKNPRFIPCFENHHSHPWPKSTTVSIGRFLYTLLRQLKVDLKIAQPKSEKREMMNALYTVYRSNNLWLKEEVRAHKVLHYLYSRAEIEELYFEPSQVPMLCPPKPWCHAKSTPFLVTPAPLVRVMADCADLQLCAINDLPQEVIYPCLDALNVLSRTPWKVNVPVLDIVTSIFLSGEGDDALSVPKNPKKMVPPDMTAVEAVSKGATRQESAQFAREKAEMYSLWCDMLYKLSIAHHFKDNVFFFPHNMDFRGRVYPCPPHFNHLGGDVIRGLLLFAEGRPLGKTGLRWLKLHLVNLTGFKKREPVEARLKYADEILDEIIDSAKNPMTGRRWWRTSDDPLQTLAACKEIVNALESPDVEKYICHFPIHQDGSCNGLQHYAALGKDLEGAQQVNLRPMDAPQDVYTGIAEVVEAQRAADSLAGVEIAQALEGKIKRKVVKQTVMTVVYGVTQFGAQLQILRQLMDIDIPRKQAVSGAKYLTMKTFASLKKMFRATREIQDWFTKCARLIVASNNAPVRWTTPLGLPVVQPYYKTSVQKCLIKEGPPRGIQMPTSTPNALKQKNGFPPNFVHSLDSTHMMLTAMFSEAAGINFVSVHDCFWTHTCSVEIMNKICREQFVALHSQPILENLSEEFRQKYVVEMEMSLKNKIRDGQNLTSELEKTLKAVPAPGEFDLKEVLRSTYFFS